MDIWLYIGYLSHLLALWFVVSVLGGMLFFRAFIGWGRKDDISLILQGAFIPVIELILAWNSIHVPLTGIYCAGLIVFGIVTAKGTDKKVEV